MNNTDIESTLGCEVIKQLPQDVVDKIAAGEVVVRPVNAVKELLENSLDAGATEIRVEIGQGGLELIRIQDNGHGIARADMPLVCARFATSKLRAVEQLRAIGTYGFRGEALASISIVSARVGITSRTAGDKCAHRASYTGGKMEGDYTSLAGLPGTTITVDRLFQNAPARKAALRYPHEEASRITDLLVRYAVHYPSVSFCFRRIDSGRSSDFRSNGSGNQHATIRALLQAKITKDLINIDFHDQSLHFSVRACLASPVTLFTSTAIQAKQDHQKVFHLFINGRCVECPRLKQAVDAVFAAKDAHCPFMTLSLEIEPSRVDVNVHPTKSIVHFLEQDRIIERIEKEFHQLANQYQKRGTIELKTANQAEKQQKVNSEEQKSNENRKRPFHTAPDGHDHDNSPKLAAKKSTSKMRVRVDASNRSMDEFTELLVDNASSAAGPFDSPTRVWSQTFVANPGCSVSGVRLVPIGTNTDSAPNGGEGPLVVVDDDEEPTTDTDEVAGSPRNLQTRQSHSSLSVYCTPRHFEFQALVQLRRDICGNADAELGQLFRTHYLIGFCGNGHALLQAGPNVFLVQFEPVLKEFFYQLAIFSFGNMGAYELRKTTNDSADGDDLTIQDLLRLYLENEDEPEVVEGPELETQIQVGCELLLEKSELLWDFFSLKVLPGNDGAKLGTLPCLLDGYLPQLASIPRLIYLLALRVDYSDELSSYASIARALGEFFTPYSPPSADDDETIVSREQHNIQSVLRALVFPALKNRFLPPSSLWDAVERVTNIEKAFKHFGRC